MSHAAWQKDKDDAFGGPFLGLVVLLVRNRLANSKEIAERKPAERSNGEQITTAKQVIGTFHLIPPSAVGVRSPSVAVELSIPCSQPAGPLATPYTQTELDSGLSLSQAKTPACTYISNH
jgi:hypothetical protein